MAINLPIPANWHLSTWRQARLVVVIHKGEPNLMASLSEQLNLTGLPVVWVSLGQDGNLPRIFYTHLAGALETAFQSSVRFPAWEWGETNPDDVEDWMAGLINGCSELNKEFFLVFEHYDRINQSEIHEALMLWLDYLPPQMTIILVTIDEPPVPLAHLRVRSQLIEIRL